MQRSLLCFAAALVTSVPLAALAQDKPTEAKPADPAPATEAEKPGDTPAADPADGAGKTEEEKKKHAAQDKFGTSDEEEAKGKTTKPKDENANQYFLGARFRDFIVPGFFVGMFADGGPGVVNAFSGGPEFMLRSGALEVIFSVTVPYADFSMNEFLFKSKDDPKEAYEIVSSSLKLITVSVDLLGRIPLERKGTVALLLGGGVGLSGVLGDLRRNQAKPKNGNANADPDQPDQWAKCEGPGDAEGVVDGVQYCGNDNDHYGGYVEPSWVNGGSKPVVFPYLALPHIGLEVVPIEQFMIRVDTGFSITGFFVGLGAGGKLPI
ncbi:MAG: hypothetical protein JNL21_11045 [Myxococcales bacterium]|nr:hypothetical protein [Myxococcales bacterium]